MSKVSQASAGHSINLFAERKSSGKKISWVTCYDAAFARLVDDSLVDAVLVGDSLGNVMHGFDHTTSVTMDHMVSHTAAVRRGLTRPLLIADMPFLSYHSSELAISNAGRLVQEGGAQCVKIEGGRDICPQLESIVRVGIPVIGHLGLTPQSIHQLGGHRVQGRDSMTGQKLLEDAKALEAAGASAIVLELVQEEVARKITESIGIATIGIGAGSNCDGQVLVLHDLLGFDPCFKPKFLKRYMDLSQIVVEAINKYDKDVKEGIFPSSEHTFH